ncbi:MAG: 4-hydroxy-tetrahydrodipicolinate reductase [Acidobacteriaceae bacterium]|nr:4-hydroxy-tetrahydrodipicolinate reductase [Acidobacteriaceae bacterium]
MRVLVLGRGKTGQLVADIATERGHSVRSLDIDDNPHASALTAEFLAGFDVVIDFTTPEAVVENLRAVLGAGAKIVVGTTGWYARLPEMLALAASRNAGLLYGTNYSIGVQTMFQLAKKMGELLKSSGYAFSIEETHHITKLDAPSGTAITLADAVKSATGLAEVPITAHRVGDAAGIHVLEAKGAADRLVLTHESSSRRGFAEGAVRAAEWLASRTGCYDFQDVYSQI